MKLLSEILGVNAANVHPNSRTADALSRAGVSKTPELVRVLNLPRRKFDATAYPDASIVYSKGKTCSTPKCGYCKHGPPALRPIQNAMLIEAAQCNGLFANVGVGGGKTLPSFLMFDAMNSRKTVLLVPPNLREKTLRVDYPELAKHFNLPPVYGAKDAPYTKPGVYVIAYSELSATESSGLLDLIEPDLIIADEAQALRHKNAARTRRFLRYMKKHGPRFVAMSGSPFNRSIMDGAHLIELALGKGSPLPNDYPSLVAWSDAIDNEGEPGHTEPGALTLFTVGDESIRSAFRRRMIDTPGVISTVESAAGMPIELRTMRICPPKPVIEALDVLTTKWAWDGNEYDQALEIARVERALTQGFFYRWIWPSGEPDLMWLEARNAWKRTIRDRLTHSNREGQDSPALLEAMAERGDWTPGEWWAWAAERHKPEPGKEAIEVSRWIVKVAQDWASGGPGIIWVDSPVVGRWLAEEGIPYFGEGADHDLLELANGPNAGQFVIACSIWAHGTGKNLQKWSRNLVTYPPASGDRWEQMIGRTHRPGQDADFVSVDVVLASHAAERAWESAKADSLFVEETTGQQQKLNLANVSVLDSGPAIL